ncbi:unnamed protein product [Parnassius apollo]|uniref:(apollo) hypothetical protein n=1 Tax=Parnassius apollo TaxID=110799 RepID=A0A8S3XDS4_PARAO|nr:unnamed protein product [Parnassius apollo]
MPALFALDDYQSCISDPIGVYCLARFDLHSDQRSQLITLIKEYSDDQIKHYNHSHVERGICVTKTCRKILGDKAIAKGVDLTDTLEKCFNKSLWEDYELKAKLSLVYYCDTYGEEDEIDLGEKVFMSTIIFILILNIAGNCYDIYVKKTGRNLNGLAKNKKKNKLVNGLFTLYIFSKGFNKTSAHGPPNCGLTLVKLVSEVRGGLIFKLKLKCVLCNMTFILEADHPGDELDIISSAVAGSIAIVCLMSMVSLLLAISYLRRKWTW